MVMVVVMPMTPVSMAVPMTPVAMMHAHAATAMLIGSAPLILHTMVFDVSRAARILTLRKCG